LTICQSHYSGTGGTGGSGAGGVDGDHIAMGNPSATTNIANENNYLMEKAQFKLSYNRSATPNCKLAFRSDMDRNCNTPG
jgi:hypothetical protein